MTADWFDTVKRENIKELIAGSNNTSLEHLPAAVKGEYASFIERLDGQFDTGKISGGKYLYKVNRWLVRHKASPIPEEKLRSKALTILLDRIYQRFYNRMLRIDKAEIPEVLALSNKYRRKVRSGKAGIDEYLGAVNKYLTRKGYPVLDYNKKRDRTNAALKNISAYEVGDQIGDYVWTGKEYRKGHTHYILRCLKCSRETGISQARLDRLIRQLKGEPVTTRVICCEKTKLHAIAERAGKKREEKRKDRYPNAFYRAVYAVDADRVKAYPSENDPLPKLKHLFNERAYSVLSLYYIEKLSIKDICVACNISRQRIFQIIRELPGLKPELQDRNSMGIILKRRETSA